ncbi:MAG TPA: TonB-dependent receptor [Ignavibacteriaceae bacterium]|nr:TonB-dependent receptor [Ignavibacteriaceae bacterium]
MVKIKFIILFAVFLVSAFSFAQTGIVHKTDSSGFYKLTDVVITATRTPSNTLELANSISIIDSSEIANKNSFNTFDILKNEYGLSFSQQGTKASVSNLYLRGANSSHTLVLVDGVEVNLTSDPSNFYNFFSLPTDNISRIEILRGPQSTLYGSNALAGVINIISAQGTAKPISSISIEGGSYNTFKGTVSSFGKLDKFNYSVALSRIKSDGYSAASEKYGNTERDGYQLDHISSILGYEFSDNFKADLIFRYNNSNSDLDQSFGPPENWDDPTYIFDQEEFVVRAQGKLNLSENKWNQKFGVSLFSNLRNYSFESSPASFYSSTSNYNGKKYKADWQNDFHFIQNNILTAGIEYEIEEMESEYYLFFDMSPPDFASIIPKVDVNTFGVFIQDQFKVGESFFGTIGVRLDNNSQFGNALTYRIAPAYMFWDTGTKLKVTFGTGFKAPSLFYLYDPLYGNKELTPEKSLGWDAGVEQFFWSDGFSIGATYFFNKFEDMFGFDPVTFQTININKAETKGVEVFTKAVLVDGLETKANYTYTNAKDISENTPDFDQQLVRRPEHKAGLFLSYSFTESTNANVEFMYVGQREEPDFINYPARIVMPDYFLINFSAHYDVLPFLRLQGRIENLLDKKYEEIYGYGTAGFSVYGGISLRVE